MTLRRVCASRYAPWHSTRPLAAWRLLVSNPHIEDSGVSQELRPNGKPTSDTALPPAGFVLLAVLTLFWGANWPAMKISLSELPVWWFRTGCLWFGGLALLAIARLMGQSVALPRGERKALLFCALFNVVAWHLFSGYGISLIAAGRAAIIAYTMPVWAALLSSPVLGEAFTRRKAVALALGVSALAVLIGPDLASLEQAPLGALFMVLAAISWAIGTVSIKRFAWSLPTTALVGWQLVLGAVPVTLGAIIWQDPPDIGALSTDVLLATAYVFVFAMVFCHWAYFRIVRLFPAAIAAIGTLAIPVVGVYSSALVLGEPVGWRELGALLLICGALAAVLIAPARRPAPPA